MINLSCFLGKGFLFWSSYHNLYIADPTQGSEIIHTPYIYIGIQDVTRRMILLSQWRRLNGRIYNLCPELVEAGLLHDVREQLQQHVGPKNNITFFLPYVL